MDIWVKLGVLMISGNLAAAKQSWKQRWRGLSGGAQRVVAVVLVIAAFASGAAALLGIYRFFSDDDPGPPETVAASPPSIRRIECSPLTVEVGDEVTCEPTVSGGRPDSWSWSGGGAPASGLERTFRTVFASTGNRTIELKVRNAGGSSSGSALIEVVRRFLGECREGTVVRSGHFCRLPDRVDGTFAVDANGYATLERYRTDYDAQGIKIDIGDPGSPNAYTIQVERISDGSWEFQVLGLWRDRGACRAEMRLFAGEFCHPPRASDGAYRRFDVYAVDELQWNDVRTVREENGYAVLWIGGQHNVNGSVVSVPNFYARKDGDFWTIGNPGP